MKLKRSLFGGIMVVLGMALLVVAFFVAPDKGDAHFPHAVVPAEYSSPQQSEPCRIKEEMPSTSFNGDANRAKIRQLRFDLERDGAWAEVDCHVYDRFGNHVPKAEIHLYFDVKEGNPESEGVVEGETGESGRFSAKHKTTYACHWRIRKEGYYESRGILPFSNHFSWDEGRKGRWTAEPLSLDVALDEKSGVELLHGRIYLKHLEFPTNTVVWFDFEAGDCVEPHGKGKNRHISFYSEGLRDPNVAIRAGVGWTNYFVFAVPPNGGLSLLNEKKTSTMPFCHEAPEVFDTQKVEFTYARSRRAIFIDSNPKEGQYIVFKTPSNASDGQEPHYGVIRNIECWPGGLRLEWFFNKTPGDRRIDGDICSPRIIDR